MKEQLSSEIQRKMLPYLNNEQLLQLRNVLNETFRGATVSYETSEDEPDEPDVVEAFATAKRIEGCSEKTLKYYRKTIEAMLFSIGKTAKQITTEDLRQYLTTKRSGSRARLQLIISGAYCPASFHGLKTKTSS